MAFYNMFFAMRGQPNHNISPQAPWRAFLYIDNTYLSRWSQDSATLSGVLLFPAAEAAGEIPGFIEAVGEQSREDW